jgi:hypothetical protein
MSLTRAQRSKINRENARKSTGPKTDGGKAASRLNALTHGLRAQTVPLPVGDPAELEALADQWVDYYRPDSPAQQEAVERAVRSIVQRRRCQRFQDAVAAEQVRSAVEQWDRDREDEVERLAATLADDPAAAVRGLGRTSQGCQWLAGRWRKLRRDLGRPDGWDAPRLDEAARLCGVAVGAEVDDDVLAERVPILTLYWRYWDAEDGRAERGLLRGELLEALDERIEGRARRLWKAIDGPDRAGAADRAVLADGPRGVLLLRYERAHASEFHRAVNLLLKLREDGGEPPQADTTGPEEPARPNEANRAEIAAEMETKEGVTSDPSAPDAATLRDPGAEVSGAIPQPTETRDGAFREGARGPENPPSLPRGREGGGEGGGAEAGVPDTLYPDPVPHEERGPDMVPLRVCGARGVAAETRGTPAGASGCPEPAGFGPPARVRGNEPIAAESDPRAAESLLLQGSSVETGASGAGPRRVGGADGFPSESPATDGRHGGPEVTVPGVIRGPSVPPREVAGVPPRPVLPAVAVVRRRMIDNGGA